MYLKNFIFFIGIASSFGMTARIFAADYPITCANNDGGPKNQKCIAISNNTKHEAQDLQITCETDTGHYEWRINLGANEKNKCLTIDDSCKIKTMFGNKQVKLIVHKNDKSTESKSCKWPNN